MNITAGLLTAGFSQYKNQLTNRPWGRPRVPYPSIDSVLNDDKASKKEAFTEKVKWGQVWGTVNLAIGGITGWLSTKIESKFVKYPLGFVSGMNLIGGVVSWIIGSFCKNDDEIEMQEIFKKHVSKEGEPKYNLDSVVINDNNKLKINAAIQEAKKKGISLNIYGPIGTGKTMTGRGIAGEIVKTGVAEKATFWYASKEVLKPSSADAIGKELFGIKLGGETVTDRIERLVANALAHYKQTGEYVVVGIDEANLLVDGKASGDSLWGEIMNSKARGASKSDPTDRPQVIQDFAKLIDKVNTEECKGVAIVLMSNNMKDRFGFLARRFTTSDSLYYGRFAEAERKKLIKMVAEKEVKEKNISQGLTDAQIDELSKIGGPVNLYDRYYVSSETNSEYDFKEHGYKEVTRKREQAPYWMKEPMKKDLRAVNVLHGDSITKSVGEAVVAFQGGLKESLFEAIKEQLTAAAEKAADDKDMHLGELAQKHDVEDYYLKYVK